MTKRELIAICVAGGLAIDGKETLADLTEALTYLVQAWKPGVPAVLEMARRGFKR